MSLHETLYQLYLVDQQVRGLEGRLEGARHHVRAHEIKIEQFRQQLRELRDQLRHTQAREAGLETEVASAEQRIDRLRQQMNSAKSNKEYSAFLVEVNTLKVDKGKLEEQALELMEQVERLRREVAEVEARIAEQEKIKAVADRELEARRAEVGDQLEQMKQKRAEAARRVPPGPLAVFERLADVMDGEAMAPIEQEDARRMEYTCGGCNMALPAEQVNQLMIHDKLVRCNSCSRILYLGEKLRSSTESRT